MAKKVAKKTAKTAPVKTGKRKYTRKADKENTAAAGDSTDSNEKVNTEEKDQVKEKVHNGHPYREDCKCGVCKARTLREKQPAIDREKLLSELPDGVGLVKIEETTYDVMRTKVAQLQEKHGGVPEQEFIDGLVNAAIVFYVKSL